MTEKMILLARFFRGKHYRLCQNDILKQCGVTGGMALDVKATQNNPRRERPGIKRQAVTSLTG
jgi:hypothetical protein